MQDFLFLGLTALLFGAMAALAKLCDWVRPR
jgi:hypothetical protein